MKDKKYREVRDHWHYLGEYRGAVHSICNLKYSVPKKIHIVFHNGPNCDYHFIIKELPEEFKKQFICLGKFIDSARFMASSLSNLVNNLSDEIHRIKCKYGHDDKKCKTCRIK